MHFCASDLLVVIGPPDKIARVMVLFDNPEKEQSTRELEG